MTVMSMQEGNEDRGSQHPSDVTSHTLTKHLQCARPFIRGQGYKSLQDTTLPSRHG